MTAPEDGEEEGLGIRDAYLMHWGEIGGWLAAGLLFQGWDLGSVALGLLVWTYVGLQIPWKEPSRRTGRRMVLLAAVLGAAACVVLYFQAQP